MRIQTFAAAVLLSLLAAGTHAAVTKAAPDQLLIQDTRTIHASPEKLYAALVDIGHWWNGEHTYSGDASHLSLKAEADGCFCERWGNQSVAHGRVIWAAPGHVLRLDTALGPLQGMAVQGVMTFTLKPAPEGASLQFEYRVNGSSGSGLDKVAQPVNEVLMEQLQRLQRYAETGAAAPAKP
ncbi:ATPase [Dyella solisilvae]|uniref:ATPase n=1 Tax=Dyella solisilvae TaxID=1920168 RepID=A0A370K8Z8_9GAMM|nr:SRPBCC family protein [Dyella solisilvae]RDI99125.1 ATPase [Dyella solisilvae]